MTSSQLVHHLLRLSGVVSLARRARAHGAVFCYHNIVADAAASGQGNGLHMPRARFQRQLEWIAQHFEVIPLSELMQRVRTGRSVRRAAALTFDDAYLGFFTQALPALRSLGLPATVFVVSGAAAAPAGFWWDHPATYDDSAGHRERWLGQLQGDGRRILEEVAAPDRWQAPPDWLPADWQTIRSASGADLEIGAHSVTHRALTTLSDDELQREVADSRGRVRAAAGVEVTTFAYPYGDWNERVRGAVRDAGYSGAVTLDYGFNPAGHDSWRLRRINVPAGISSPAFEAWASGLNLRAAFGRAD